MTENLEKKFYWFYLIAFSLIVVLPLISFPPLLHPPSFAKSILFRIILSVIILVFIYHNFFLKGSWFSEIKKSFNVKSKIFVPLLLLTLLGLIYTLATIFSQEPHFSFWGSPFRGGGSLTILLLIVFSVLISFIIKKKAWETLWNISIVAGILVSLIAVFQRFGMFSQILLHYEDRPISTLGGPIFLALYLLLLLFPTLSLAIKSCGIKRVFYFASLFLFIFVIILTATRSALLGMTAAGLFFLFFYPESAGRRNAKKLLIAKISVGALIIIGLLFAFWLGGKPEAVKKIEENPIVGVAFQRAWDVIEPLLNIKEFSFVKIVTQDRYSGWETIFKGVKEKPLLGYGPENVSIPFDKYYDPRIPGISMETGAGGTGWWDKAHNILLDMAATIGIPGLIIYLAVLLIIFWKIKKVKKQKPLTVHGIQAAFIAYFITNLFNFDVFSTYLILFFLIGYSLFLIREGEEETDNRLPAPNNALWKYVLFTLLIFFGLWFIWSANLKPLMINKDLNIAVILDERQNDCETALKTADSLLTKHSIIDNFVRLRYLDIISDCLGKYPSRESKEELSYKAVDILEEAKKLRPTYTRSWLYSALFLDRIIMIDSSLTEEQKKELIDKTLYNLKGAEELSPLRVQLAITYIRTYLLMDDYDKAYEKINLCLELDKKSPNCYWAKALFLVARGEEKSEETLELIKTAADMSASAGYSVENKNSILQLIKFYAELAEKTKETRYYEILADLYKEMIEIEPTNFQNHASLAYAYAILGEYDKARGEAAIVLKLSPESEPNVKAFLDTLPK